jgi:hypothetical protein
MPQGKYSNWPKYALARLQRGGIKMSLRPLVSWEPLRDPKEGYSLLIGCNAPLAEMLGANLRMLSRQKLDHLDRIYVVFDRPPEELPIPVEARMRELFPQLPLEFRFYNAKQVAVSKRLGLPWVYAWMSWCIGLAECRTRYALMHDFDAMLLRDDIIEERYRVIRETQAEFCGIRTYEGGGVYHDDGLVTTFELMFDAKFIRDNYHPVELVNTIRPFKGRYVDFDILLHIQSKAGKKHVLPIDEEHMVHPSQVIDHFTRISHFPNYVPPPSSSVLMVPYFLHLSDRSEPMRDLTQSLAASADGKVQFFPRVVDFSRLSRPQAAWLKKQANRLEQAVFGQMRPEVQAYFDAISAMVERQPISA